MLLTITLFDSMGLSLTAVNIVLGNFSTWILDSAVFSHILKLKGTLLGAEMYMIEKIDGFQKSTTKRVILHT